MRKCHFKPRTGACVVFYSAEVCGRQAAVPCQLLLFQNEFVLLSRKDYLTSPPFMKVAWCAGEALDMSSELM